MYVAINAFKAIKNTVDCYQLKLNDEKFNH